MVGMSALINLVSEYETQGLQLAVSYLIVFPLSHQEFCSRCICRL